MEPKWTGTITWDGLNKAWGDLWTFLRERLPINEEWQFNEQGQKEPSGRPLGEDIICCRAAKDMRLLFYLQEAGLKITDITARRKVHNLGVRERMPILTAGRGKKSARQPTRKNRHK